MRVLRCQLLPTVHTIAQMWVPDHRHLRGKLQKTPSSKEIPYHLRRRSQNAPKLFLFVTPGVTFDGSMIFKLHFV